jgi:hypothetical protein
MALVVCCVLFILAAVSKSGALARREVPPSVVQRLAVLAVGSFCAGSASFFSPLTLMPPWSRWASCSWAPDSLVPRSGGVSCRDESRASGDGIARLSYEYSRFVFAFSRWHWAARVAMRASSPLLQTVIRPAPWSRQSRLRITNPFMFATSRQIARRRSSWMDSPPSWSDSTWSCIAFPAIHQTQVSFGREISSSRPHCNLPS